MQEVVAESKQLTEPVTRATELRRPKPEAGISIIVCCHNSSELLPATLQHLKAQQAVDIGWEVVLVDNASTDDTAEKAQEIWGSTPEPAPLRIVREPQLGLTFARERGLSVAKYEFLCFVDDDNWIAPDWVRTVWEVMSEHPKIGACGGLSRAEFRVAPPSWFYEYAHLYAILPDSPQTGDVSAARMLWGAGLTVRRSALVELSEDFGFQSVLVGRKGTRLSSGEDAELSLALRAAGWSLWLEPRLQFVHYIPLRRLNWRYLRRLAYGSAFATPAHDAIYFAGKAPRYGVLRIVRSLRESWTWQVLSAGLGIVRHPLSLLSTMLFPREGAPGAIRVEFQKGRFMGLLEAFRWYGKRRRTLGRSFGRAARSTDSIVECSS